MVMNIKFDNSMSIPVFILVLIKQFKNMLILIIFKGSSLFNLGLFILFFRLGNQVTIFQNN